MPYVAKTLHKNSVIMFNAFGCETIAPNYYVMESFLDDAFDGDYPMLTYIEDDDGDLMVDFYTVWKAMCQ